jgi:plasmid stabilization system protein ParE
MKVRFTPRAFSDLEAIRTYIAQYNPAAAGRVVALIEKLAFGWAISPNPANDPTSSMRGSSFRRDTHIVFIIALLPEKC